MERIIQQHMNRKGADLDLLEQFQLYETMLQHEDGECEGLSPKGTRCDFIFRHLFIKLQC